MAVPPTAAHNWSAIESLLQTLLPAREQQYHLTWLPAGTVIHRYGTPCRGIFFVKEGTIKVSLPGHDGQTKAVFEVGPGSAVGITAVIGKTYHESTAEVTQDARGCFVSAETLQSWLANDACNYQCVAVMLGDWNDKVLKALGGSRAQNATQRAGDKPGRVEGKE